LIFIFFHLPAHFLAFVELRDWSFNDSYDTFCFKKIGIFMKNKVKVVIGQLGSPRSTKVSDVRAYLKEFLGDPRVVDINQTLWKIILYLFVLPFRPKKSAQAYSRIWDGSGFPLVKITESFAHKLKPHLDANIELNHCFLLSKPRVEDLFLEWEKEDFATRADSVLVIPQFPQYAESTSGSVVDVLAKSLGRRVNIPNLQFMGNYHHAKCFIDHSVGQISTYLAQFKNQKHSITDLVISFHGIPLRRVLEKKDIYFRHCVETFVLIQQKLKLDPSIKMHINFQSRFGSEQWLGPATDEYVCDLVKQGSRDIAVYCPSFVVDCLETVDEIGHELAEDVHELGGHLHFIPCLNDGEEWARDYAHFINVSVNGSTKEQRELYYDIDAKEVMQASPKQEYENPPLSKEAKSVLKIMFLTLFLDLVGFSIIFPIFPQLAKHYLSTDADNYFLKLIFQGIESVTAVSNTTGLNPVVLFGGVLGAIYSLLQFVAAPIWGGLSDRFGRKPILFTTVLGLFLSYVLWFFAKDFTWLILARFIGGIMGGNLSVASAVVADVTDAKNRSKGMAFIGIAFALGFIFGPAIGGLLCLIDLTQLYPHLKALGVNPFSSPALLAAVLSFINLFLIIKKFPETLPKNKKTEGHIRSANPIKLFSPLPYRNVNMINWSYFLFILAFSGMEFTLTFLAFDRLGFTPLQNGYMFIYIGFLIAMVQGGYVRRKAGQVGEKKMAIQGLITTLPGLVVIAIANTTPMLYVGLFFLAVGSAMGIPTLTSLVSLLTPAHEQGRSLGIFRSLGSLGRVIGPLAASVIYWRFGSAVPYYIGAAFLMLPIIILILTDATKKNEAS
jgi:ferrochelatase